MRFSSRVLKGLTYRPTGAIVAAPTTSLPEDGGGERNWDYRFAWIRDASLTLEALYIGTCSDEAENFVSFMTSAAGGRVMSGSLQIMYGIGGEHDLSERELPHLRGWRDSRPVRVGNGAWDQTQLDVYGELLNTLHLYREQLGDLHPEIQRFVADLADAAAAGWREKDAGMWEMRGEPRHHLSSKVLCWTALDRAVKLAPALGEFAKAGGVGGGARPRFGRRSSSAAGARSARPTRSRSTPTSSMLRQLLMPILGFLPANDPRMRSTIEAIARDLTEDGLVLRYRNPRAERRRLEGRGGHVRDLLVLAGLRLAQAGEIERARGAVRPARRVRNDLGLLAEEIDTRAASCSATSRRHSATSA